jgi:hypothetical protein
MTGKRRRKTGIGGQEPGTRSKDQKTCPAILVTARKSLYGTQGHGLQSNKRKKDYHGWKCISEEEALIVDIPTEVYAYSPPDEYRLVPH